MMASLMSEISACTLFGDDCQAGDIGLHGPNGATMGSPGRICPGKLWSLWDMLHSYGHDLVLLTIIIDSLWHHADESDRYGAYDGQTAHVSLQLFAAARLAARIPLPSVNGQIERIASMIEEEGYSVLTMFAFLKELRNRLEDDAAAIQFVHVTPEFTRLYEEADLFGENVSTNFPSAIDDIAEAGKCLALGRGTATVFHLMRVMEAGLKVLGKSLEIPYAPSWESYLKQINTQMSAEHRTKSEEWKKDEPFYRDMAGDLQIIKSSWRNPTMHIVKKYTPDEADGIFRAVRSFMQRLATRFSEASAAEQSS
jgi:hypothetical protein